MMGKHSWEPSRQREVKSRSLPWRGFGPDAAAVPFHDSPADREAEAGSRIFRAGVKSFEESKDLLLELRFETDAIVLNGE